MKLKEAERDAILVELVSAVGLQRLRFDSGTFYMWLVIIVIVLDFCLCFANAQASCIFYSCSFRFYSKPGSMSLFSKDSVCNCSRCPRSYSIWQDGQSIQWFVGAATQGSCPSLHTRVWYLSGGNSVPHCARIKLFRSVAAHITAEGHRPQLSSWQPRRCGRARRRC